MSLCPRCHAPVEPQDACPEHGLAGIAPTAFAWLAEAPLLGQVVDERFALVDVIGVGGMGVVYRGIQRPLGRTVAVKVLDPALTSTAEARQRFGREALALSRLRSNHTVTLFDYGVVARGPLRDTAYMAMEWVESASLLDLLQDGPVPLEIVRVLLVGIARSLDEAHRQGILHRDIKPENILVTGPENTWHATVIDFGIAAFGGDPVTSGAGSVLGTPQYMAPELCAAGTEAASPQSDVYAVGILLYELLAGHRPFEGPDTPSVLLKHYTTAVPDLPEGRTHQLLDPVIRRALAKRAGDRYPSVEALRDAFEAALEGEDDSLTVQRPALPSQDTETGESSISEDISRGLATPREASGDSPLEPESMEDTGQRRVILQVMAGPRLLDFAVLDNDWVTVGRSSRCEFVLPHRGLASFHARCRLVADNQVAVEHLGGEGETCVNLAPIRGEVRAGFGDLIQMGPFLLKVRAVTTRSLRHLHVLESCVHDPGRDPRTGLGRPTGLERTMLTLEHRCEKLGQPMSAVLVRTEPFDGTLTAWDDPLGNVVSESVARLAMFVAPDPATCILTDADDVLVLLVGQHVHGAHRYAEELHERVVAHLWEFLADSLAVNVLTAVARRVRAPANEWLSELERELAVTALVR